MHKAAKMSSTVTQSVRDHWLTLLTWPIPSSWSLENTMSPTENSILERNSLLMSPRYPSPFHHETSVAAAPLCSCQQGRVCACVYLCTYICTSWGGVGSEVSIGRVMTPPPLEGSGPHTCGTSHLSMANSHKQVTLKTQQRPLTSFSTKAMRWPHKPLPWKVHTLTRIIYLFCIQIRFPKSGQICLKLIPQKMFSLKEKNKKIDSNARVLLNMITCSGTKFTHTHT